MNAGFKKKKADISPQAITTETMVIILLNADMITRKANRQCGIH